MTSLPCWLGPSSARLAAMWDRLGTSKVAAQSSAFCSACRPQVLLGKDQDTLSLSMCLLHCLCLLSLLTPPVLRLQPSCSLVHSGSPASQTAVG